MFEFVAWRGITIREKYTGGRGWSQDGLDYTEWLSGRIFLFLKRLIFICFYLACSVLSICFLPSPSESDNILYSSIQMPIAFRIVGASLFSLFTWFMLVVNQTHADYFSDHQCASYTYSGYGEVFSPDWKSFAYIKWGQVISGTMVSKKYNGGIQSVKYLDDWRLAIIALKEFNWKEIIVIDNKEYPVLWDRISDHTIHSYKTGKGGWWYYISESWEVNGVHKRRLVVDWVPSKLEFRSIWLFTVSPDWKKIAYFWIDAKWSYFFVENDKKTSVPWILQWIVYSWNSKKVAYGWMDTSKEEPFLVENGVLKRFPSRSASISHFAYAYNWDVFTYLRGAGSGEGVYINHKPVSSIRVDKKIRKPSIVLFSPKRAEKYTFFGKYLVDPKWKTIDLGWDPIYSYFDSEDTLYVLSYTDKPSVYAFSKLGAYKKEISNLWIQELSMLFGNEFVPPSAKDVILNQHANGGIFQSRFTGKTRADGFAYVHWNYKVLDGFGIKPELSVDSQKWPIVGTYSVVESLYVDSRWDVYFNWVSSDKKQASVYKNGELLIEWKKWMFFNDGNSIIVWSGVRGENGKTVYSCE